MQINNPKRPSPEDADKALNDVVETERERGDVNPGAEPDQKTEVEPPPKAD
jgi:hypothetical protein